MSDRESSPSKTRWVKIVGIIAIVLVLLFVIIQLTCIGGDHGPGLYTQPSEKGV